MKAGIKRWAGRVPDVSDVLARFPVPAGLMTLFTFTIIFDDMWPDDEQMVRLLVGLVIAGYVCVSFVVTREAQKRTRAVPIQLALSILIVGLAWVSVSLRLNLAMALGAVLLLLGNAVIWRQARNDIHVWDFTHKIWTGAVFATVGSIIFTIGIFSIQFALKTLFGVNMNNLTEDIILPIGLGLLAPIYWLATVPKVDEDFQSLYDNPGFVSKAVAFLGTWLLAPLTLIYAAILIAYGLKIILTGSLPKGEIAALTTPFLLIGTLTWLLLDPPFVREKTLAKLFRRTWFYIMIPATLLLAVAVFVRVGAYGLTPERIALTLCITWALGIGVWFGFAPSARRDIRFIPGLGVALLAVGTFVSDGLSFSNQLSRAEANLIKAGIMDTSGVVKPFSDIIVTDEAAGLRAKGALRYVSRNNGRKALTKLFEGADAAPDLEAEGIGKVLVRLKLDELEEDTRRYQYINYENPSKFIPNDGYDKIYTQSFVYLGNSSEREVVVDKLFGVYVKNGEIRVEYLSEEITRFDLKDWVSSRPSGGGDMVVDNPIINLFDDGTRRVSLVIIRADYQSRNNNAIEPDIQSMNVTLHVMTSGF